MNTLLIGLLALGDRAEMFHYTTVQKQWRLATSAILTQRNHEDFYSLTGDATVLRVV